MSHLVIKIPLSFDSVDHIDRIHNFIEESLARCEYSRYVSLHLITNIPYDELDALIKLRCFIHSNVNIMIVVVKLLKLVREFETTKNETASLIYASPRRVNVFSGDIPMGYISHHKEFLNILDSNRDISLKYRPQNNHDLPSLEDDFNRRHTYRPFMNPNLYSSRTSIIEQNNDNHGLPEAIVNRKYRPRNIFDPDLYADRSSEFDQRHNSRGMFDPDEYFASTRRTY